jgi:hypothetical protein
MPSQVFELPLYYSNGACVGNELMSRSVVKIYGDLSKFEMVFRI